MYRETKGGRMKVKTDRNERVNERDRWRRKRGEQQKR